MPGIVQQAMDRFAKLTGRQYSLFGYIGAPDAERVLVQMGSGVGASREAVDKLVAAGEKVGLLTVRLYRPFDMQAFVAALPKTRALDRRARPHQGARRDRRAAVPGRGHRAGRGLAARHVPLPRVIGGRYGLSSKEFTPAMAKAALDELRAGASPSGISPSASSTTSRTCR